MKKTRRKIDAALKAKIALEALREQATVADLAHALRGSPEPDLCLEEAAAGERGACLRSRASGWRPSERARSGDREAARQDRAADGRAGFFSQEVRTMSTPDRRAMLDRDHPELSIRAAMRCCSGWRARGSTAAAAGERRRRSGADAADRRAVHWPGRSSARGGWRRCCGPRAAGQPQAGAAADAADGDRGARPEAADDRSRRRGTRSSRTCCATWRSTGRTRSGRPTSPTSRSGAASCIWWRSSTGPAGRCWPGGCRTRWTSRSASTHWRRRWRASASRRSSTPTRAASSPATAFTGRLAAAGDPDLDGRARPLDGQRLHRAAVALAQVRGRLSEGLCRRPRGAEPGSRPGSAFTTAGVLTRRWATARRWRSGATASPAPLPTTLWT